jgi:DNA replication and repair protein RecF
VQPLRVRRLATRGFRNLGDTALEPGPRFNVVHGDNGQGKSNLLEALYYVATLRSFRGATSDELVRRGTSEGQIVASVEHGPIGHDLSVHLRAGAAREVRLDGRRPRSHASYRNALPAVLFHPADVQLVGGAPDRRRVLVDETLEQLDATFAATAAAYDRALRSRNRLLRTAPDDRRAIGAYDEILASAGAVVGQGRERLIGDLGPRVAALFAEIGGEDGELKLGYAPKVEPRVEALKRALAAEIEKDCARGYTGVGPHADDIAISLAGARARRFASQGQQRAVALALKVAELEALERRTRKVPVLLLDDVSSELDRAHNRRLFACLARLGGQVFLTTTHPEFILLDQDRTDFLVRAGTIARA